MKYFTNEEHETFIKNIERDLRKYYSECYCTHYWKREEIDILDVFLTLTNDKKEDVIKTSIFQNGHDRSFTVNHESRKLRILTRLDFKTYEEAIDSIQKLMKGIEFLLVE